jgi:DNA polymerase III subunit delta'
MSWSSVVNQQRVKTLLRSLRESGRLPHALLFHGPEGVGKEAAALALARSLNCESGRWEPCGFCADCRRLHTLEHPHLHLIFALPSKEREDSAYDKFTDAEMEEVRAQIRMKAEDPYHRISIPRAAGIKIASIRDIRHQASMRAEGAGRHVVVICEAERMNTNAANALLKTLEEPGGDLLLILCTAHRDQLPPTIVSRCQQVRFDPLSEADIRTALARETDIPADRIDLAAQLANGSYTRALELAAGAAPFERQDILTYIRAVVAWRPVTLMEHIRRIASFDDRNDVELFLASVASWFRDVLACAEGRPDAIRNTDLKEAIQNFTRFYTDVRCDEALRAIDDIIDRIRKNVHLHTALIVLSQRLRRCIIPSGE